MLTVYNETFWAGVKRGAFCQLLKEDLIGYQPVGAICWRPLPGQFDKVTQQVCPFVGGSLHPYYHGGLQHFWGMAGSFISGGYIERYANIGPQDMSHFYQHINSLTFLGFSHLLQFHVPKRCHQTAPKLEPSFSLHDSTSGTSETQRRPSAGLANSSCHGIESRSLELQFVSPHFRWINLEKDIYIIQIIPKPDPMMMRDVHVMFELGLHYAGDRTTN